MNHPAKIPVDGHKAGIAESSQWAVPTRKGQAKETLLCGDVLVVGTKDHLLGIDIIDGAIRWQHSLSDSAVRMVFQNSSLYVWGRSSDFRVAVAVSDQGDHVIPPSDGAEDNEWKIDESEDDEWVTDEAEGDSGPGSGDDELDIDQGEDEGPAQSCVIVLDIATGRPRPLETSCTGAGAAERLKSPVQMAVQSGVLMLTDNGGRLHAWDAETGEPWSWKSGGDEKVACLSPAHAGETSPGPAAYGERAMVFTLGDTFYCYNARSGQQRWAWTPPSNDFLDPGIEPFIGKGLMVVSGGGAVYFLDAVTGKEKFPAIPTGGRGNRWNPPLILEDRDCLVLTSSGGSIKFIELSSGTLVCEDSVVNLNEQVGDNSRTPNGLMRPVANTDVVESVSASRRTDHLDDARYLFMACRSGHVFQLSLDRDDSNWDLAAADRYTVKLVAVQDCGKDGQVRISDPGAVAGNGTLMLPLEPASGGSHTHEVVAWPYAAGRAPFFKRTGTRGETSITIGHKDAYRFGADDFSVEAWVRTTRGGHIVTQSPSGGSTGFLLSMMPKSGGDDAGGRFEGRLRFGIFDRNALLTGVQTRNAAAADGAWHHVAVVRSGATAKIFVDGISQPVDPLVNRSQVPDSQLFRFPGAGEFLPAERVGEGITVPAVDSPESLVIGSLIANKDIPDPGGVDFAGQIADVRIWNTGLTVRQIQDRMPKLLTGSEPGLAGYWPLNEHDAADFKDLTHDQRLDQPSGVSVRPTNLSLDDSLYPYLINHVSPEWPNKERWIARGEEAPVGSPAGVGETVVFATGMRLYAVDLAHGARKWAVELNAPSAPKADAQRFYTLDDDTLRAFDPDTGARLWSKTLETSASTGAFAVSGNCVVATADGKIFHWIRKTGGETLGKFTASGPIEGDIVAGGGQVCFLAGGRLHRFADPDLPEDGEGKAPAVLKPGASANLMTSGTPRLCLGGKQVFVYDGDRVHSFDLDTLTPGQQTAFVSDSLESGEAVTGMAAAPTADRLVLSTNGGRVLFRSFGSGKTIHEETVTAAKPEWENPSVFPPIIREGVVYCTVAAKTAGKPDGGVFVYDLKTGRLRGREDVDSAPTGPAYVKAGTAFFGCDDKGASGRKEAEAIHSVVFGDHLALERGKGDVNPITVPNLDESWKKGDYLKSGNGIDSGNFSVELWVNPVTGTGGELISVPAGTHEGKTHAGFRLALDGEGRIVAEHLNPGAASRFTSEPTSAANGHWHHVAAVFKNDSGRDRPVCQIYLDSKPLAGIQYKEIEASAGVEVRSATIAGEGKSAFRGMMDEVRVWNTWLHAAEISSRRNVQLRGNEAELMACWRFGDHGVQDASMCQLDNSDTSPNLWLTDLSFEKPHYPFLCATTEVQEPVKAEDAGVTTRTTTFTTTILTRQADGMPLKGAALSGEVEAVDGGTMTIEGSSDQSFQGNADSKGRFEVTVSITEKDPEGPPELPLIRIHAGFMYKNEFFHMNPALDRQFEVRIPTPRLTAQSVLIQDFHYDEGDSAEKMGTYDKETGILTPAEHADVSTIRTTITAARDDGSPIPNEPLEIWADDHAVIEVDGKPYDVNRDNSALFKTGADGTLTVVFHEDHAPRDSGSGGKSEPNLLKSPLLEVRAGFMPRNARFAIDPAAPCHKTLSEVEGDHLTGKKKLSDDKPEQPRLVDKHLEEAGKADSVAATIQQIASLAKKHEIVAEETAAGAANDRPEPLSGARFLHEALLPADHVQAIFGSAHVRPHAPVTPEYMPSKHFVLHFDEDGNQPLSHHHFHHEDELDKHLKATLKRDFRQLSEEGREEAAGWWPKDQVEDLAEDAWEGVKGAGEAVGGGIVSAGEGIAHGAEDAWDNASTVIVKTWDEVKEDVGHVVQFVEVIVEDVAGKITSWVIETVQDVVNHLVAFIKKIVDVIKKLIDFLRALFAWKTTLEIHDVIRDMINDNLEGLKRELGGTIRGDLHHFFADARETIDQALGLSDDHSSTSLAGLGQNMGGTGTKCVSQTRSGKGQWGMQKLKEHGQGSGETLSEGLAPSGQKPGIDEDFQKMVGDFQEILTQSGGLTHLSLDEVLNLLGDLIHVVLDAAEELADLTVEVAEAAIDAILEMLNTELPIPFLSQLYELITGNKLTILDLVCLIVAIPAHLVLAILGVKWDKRKTGGALNELQVFPKSGAAAGAGLFDDHTVKTVDSIYLVFTVFNGFLAMGTDIVQGLKNAEDPREVEGAAGSGAGPGVKESPFKKVVGTLKFVTAAGSSFCRWAVIHRYKASQEWKWTQVSVFLGLAPTVIFTGLGSKGAFSLTKSTEETYGRLKGIQLEPLLSLLGLGLLVNGLIETCLAQGIEDKKLKRLSTGEGLVGVAGGFNTACSWLNWAPVVRESEIDGVPTTPFIKGAMDVALISMAQPALHLSLGYGREVWD